MKLSIKIPIFIFIWTIISLTILVFSFSMLTKSTMQKTIGENSVMLVEETLDKIDRDIYNKIERWQTFGDPSLPGTLIKSNQEFAELDNIQNYIDEKDKEWTSVSKEEITPFMNDLINNELSKELRKRAKTYKEKYGFRIFAEVFLANKYGANAAQTGKTTDYYQADEEWWQIAKQDGLYVGDVEYDRSAAIYSTDIGIRIDDEKGNFSGVMKVILNIEEVINIIKELKPVGIYKTYKTTEFKLLTGDGRVIYSTEEFKFLEDFSDELSFIFQEKERVHYFIAAGDQPGESEELVAHAHSKGYKNYQGLGWILVIEHETEEIFAPITAITFKIGLLIILTFGLAASLAMFFVTRLITKPISNLTRTAQTISEGDLSTRAEVKSNDEIGQLAKNFNQMTDKLVQALQRQKEYAAERVAKIVPILQKISMGDFSGKLKIPEKEDEFTELLVALDLMIDDLKETEKVRREAEETRIAITVERARTEEAKKAEMILREEKNKLRKYFDTAGVIILVLSPEKKVLLINKKGSEILRYKGREIIGKDWLAGFIPEKNRAEVRNVFERLVDKRMDHAEYFESPVLIKNGGEKTIAWHNALLKDEQGKVQAILSVGGDITELKRAKITIEQLKELNRMKDDFLNIATHELKTPLTSIVGLSEIISTQEPSLLPKNQKYIDIIHDEGNKLSHIIKRILTVTRFESGKEIVQFEPIDLTVFIPMLLPSLKVLAKKKKSRIVTKLEKKNIVVRSDKEKISQVIYNFVDNAVKYGPEGQTITVSITKPEKGQVKIAVIDQGPGISPGLQKRLFTKFSQLEPSLTRSQEGTGLGLYICKLIVDKLGGKIGVKSLLGKGSTFYFTLPIRKKSNNLK